MSTQIGPPPASAGAGPAPAPMLPPIRSPESLKAEQEMFAALTMCATKSLGSLDAREVKEFAASALNFAQAIVILDPALVAPQGVPPEVIARTMPAPPEPKPINNKAAKV